MTVDTFAIELVLDGTPMNLTGPDLEAAVLALADRGHTYQTIADRCRKTEGQIRRTLDAGRKRAKAAARQVTA